VRERAARKIARHPVEHLQELVRVVRGIDDRLIGMATVAGEQELLLLVGAGHAGQPFGVGQLRREILRLSQFDDRVGGDSASDIDAARPDEVVPDGADFQEVVAVRKFRGGEIETAPSRRSPPRSRWEILLGAR
jgi:hypothetical protein